MMYRKSAFTANSKPIVKIRGEAFQVIFPAENNWIRLGKGSL
jgi:hypothetical protein